MGSYLAIENITPYGRNVLSFKNCVNTKTAMSILLNFTYKIQSLYFDYEDKALYSANHDKFDNPMDLFNLITFVTETFSYDKIDSEYVEKLKNTYLYKSARPSLTSSNTISLSDESCKDALDNADATIKINWQFDKVELPDSSKTTFDFSKLIDEWPVDVFEEQFNKKYTSLQKIDTPNLADIPLTDIEDFGELILMTLPQMWSTDNSVFTYVDYF